MKSIKVCEYSRSRSFHYDLILQDQASGERSQDQWSSGCYLDRICTPNGMFIFIILVIHRETGGISQLGLSYQINEENTPNIRYLANYLKNIP